MASELETVDSFSSPRFLFLSAPVPQLHHFRSMSPFQSAAAIEAKNLSFSATTMQGNSIPMLQDCSLEVPSGQLWMLLGPSACGKSTLLKILAGLSKP